MSEGAFSSRIPRCIEPGKLAQQKLELVGHVPADSLNRVAELVLSLSQVDCSIVFSIDEQYRRLLGGHIKAQVTMPCQRCLNAVGQELDVEVNIALVKDEEQAKALPAWLDPWLVDGSEADFYELVEEELLLNLPQFAWHDDNCIDPALYSSGEAVSESGDRSEKGENPFSKLAQLKAKSNPE